MSYTHNLWLYTLLLFGIIIVPGMDMFFAMANGLAGGRARGLAATMGLVAGGVYHTLFGALAVGALLAAAPQLLTGILLASATYMAWIGYTLVRSSITVDSIGTTNAKTLRTAFTQGFITCVLNPKAYMFVIGVYPTFIQPRFGAIWAQALVMGLLTALVQFVIYGTVAMAAARGRDMLIRNPTTTIWVGRSVGAVFIALAVFTVVQALR